ncbi:MAG: hypothetical protein RL557_608 [archaeon]|jgi:epoxide hydrolase-like predicted phosphatase
MKQMKKQKEEIKAVIFDIGGVLSLPHYYVQKGRHEFSGIHESIAHALGITSDQWFDAIDTLYGKAIVGKVSRKKFIAEVSRRLSVSKQKLVSIITRSYHKGMMRNDQLFTLTQKLKKNRIIVGILSDQWHLSRESIFSKRDEALFDIVIISYEVKTRKPHPEMYTILMKKITAKNKKIKPSEVVFIDDKMYNLEPAKKLGVKTILFRNNKQVMRELRKFID